MISRIATTLGLAGYLRNVLQRLMRPELDRLQRQIAQLETSLEEMSTRSARADRVSAQLKSLLVLNRSQRDEVARLEGVLDEPRIEQHVRKAIASAPLQTDPYPHIIVERLLPVDVYKVLLKSIPPPAFFADHDPIKQNIRIPLDFGPDLAVRMLGFLDQFIARDTIRPAVLEKFHDPLERHYREIFGAPFLERASRLPQAVSGGRLMLRRPGYHLAAHRDPKRSLITCLLYLAKSTDEETYGTHIYRVIDDREAGYTQSYYPEQDGRRCELVKTVPYRPNTMLVFLNSGGAHGAAIPDDAPAHLERYTYQFYLGPSPEALEALVQDLPPERRAMWRSKPDVISSPAS